MTELEKIEKKLKFELVKRVGTKEDGMSSLLVEFLKVMVVCKLLVKKGIITDDKIASELKEDYVISVLGGL
jgi:transcription initiation factor IIE alpha subunit|tara:strand:- start:551 stop:763 length:213 start_codon:yes stop_codon:yes gene_type:complete